MPPKSANQASLLPIKATVAAAHPPNRRALAPDATVALPHRNPLVNLVNTTVAELQSSGPPGFPFCWATRPVATLAPRATAATPGESPGGAPRPNRPAGPTANRFAGPEILIQLVAALSLAELVEKPP